MPNIKSLYIMAGIAAMAAFTPNAAAQNTAVTDDVQTAILYGDEAAPACPENVICVVARLPEGDRYRIPETLRFSTDPENTSWAGRVEQLQLVGRTGTLSCSPAEAGGFTGCTQELIRKAYGEDKTSPNVRFSDLIAAARADRLAQIDAKTAEEQARVEQIEREYMERLEKERAAELPAISSDAAQPKLTTPPQ